MVNLDTGESVPLSSAEEKIPRCVNPLSLHIMRRTKEYRRFVDVKGIDAAIGYTDDDDNNNDIDNKKG